MSAEHTLDAQQVRASFNKAAHTYASVSVLQQEVAMRLAKRLSCFKKHPQTILDAGCGTGFLLGLLQTQYPEAQIFGLDIALNMLLQTRVGLTLPTPLVLGDIQQLPFAAQSMDLIVCNCVLHWCNDLRTVFSEFRRLLKPDGVLMFTTFGPDTLFELRHSFASISTDPHVHRFLDLHILGDGLLQSGLQDPVMDMQKITLTYACLQDLFLDLRNMGATNHLKHRSQGLMGKQRFRKMQQAYIQFQTKQQLFPATYEIVYGYATGANAMEPLTPSESPQRDRVMRVLQ